MDDGSLQVHRSGTGQAVVLVHGSMDSAGGFRAVADQLGDRTVIRYDRRGYERSAGPDAVPVSFDDHVDDLVELLGCLDRPAVLVGHSLGGAITLTAATRVPERVRAVLAYEPPMPWLEWWPAPHVPPADATADEVVATAELFLRRHMGDARWSGLPERTRSLMLGWGPAWAAELRSAAARAPFQPAEVAVPVLAVHGSATDERHERSTVLIARDIPGARLEIVPDAGHRGHRDSPEALAKLVRSLAA